MKNTKAGVGRKKGTGSGFPFHAMMPLWERERAFWKLVNKDGPGGCWIWKGSGGTGYGRFSFAGHVVLAHRFAWFLAHGRWPLKWILHRCDTPPCVNPEHIYEGTAAENNRDAARRGRSRHWGHPKISPATVREIRQLYATGNYSYTTLAEHMKLPKTQIFSALNKWKTLNKYAETS